MGMGELHLEIICGPHEARIQRLKPMWANLKWLTKKLLPMKPKSKTNISTDWREGQVRSREKLNQTTSQMITRRKVPKNAHREVGFEFIDAIKGGVIPQEFIPCR